MVQCSIKFILIYLKQIFLQNKPYQRILLKIKEYCGKWQNLNYKIYRTLCIFRNIKTNWSTGSKKNPGGNFGNVLQACSQETTIRKRRFELQEACGKLPAHLLDVVQSNYDLWFYKTYRRNLFEQAVSKPKPFLQLGSDQRLL